MDTIRTLYVSADQAVKAANNTYEYNIVGGISVAEGSRVYVDNIAMVNNVCDEVDDKTIKCMSAFSRALQCQICKIRT